MPLRSYYFFILLVFSVIGILGGCTPALRYDHDSSVAMTYDSYSLRLDTAKREMRIKGVSGSDLMHGKVKAEAKVRSLYDSTAILDRKVEDHWLSVDPKKVDTLREGVTSFSLEKAGLIKTPLYYSMRMGEGFLIVNDTIIKKIGDPFDRIKFYREDTISSFRFFLEPFAIMTKKYEVKDLSSNHFECKVWGVPNYIFLDSGMLTQKNGVIDTIASFEYGPDSLVINDLTFQRDRKPLEKDDIFDFLGYCF